jgi:hypothetical protein
MIKYSAINRLITLLTILTFIIVFSCENTPLNFNVDCNECTTYEPDSADLTIYLTIDESNPYVPVVFYRGNVEENVVEWVDTFYAETWYLKSRVEQFYSIKATYKTTEGDTIIAIDGDKLKTTFVTDVCENDCYVVKGGKLDVRLK